MPKRVGKDGSLVGPGEPGYDDLGIQDLRAVVSDLIEAVHDLQTRVAQLDHQENPWPDDGQRLGANRQNIEPLPDS